MHELDPFGWSAIEVSVFFNNNNIDQFMQDHALDPRKLPDREHLANQLLSSDVNGQALLHDVDRDLLKNEFNISSLKERLTVVAVIRALRRISTGYANSIASNPLNTALPTPHASLPQTPTEPPQIGVNVRKGEALVNDLNGRKRRRLNLMPAESVNSADAFTSKASPTPLGYLQDERLQLDTIFYGTTAFGSEVTHSEAEDDDAFDNFTIIGKPTFAGNAAFVHRSLRRAFQHQHSTTRDIMYHNRRALVANPYPESAMEGKDLRSVTVFQASDNGVKVLREKELTLSYQTVEAVEHPADVTTKEWSYLLTKYGGSAESELVPDYDADQVVYQTDSDSDSDDDMAEEDENAESSTLTEERIESLINAAIESQTQAWKDRKQPKLDKNKARAIWRMAKGRRQNIKVLTRRAHDEVRRLEVRLERFKKGLLERTWDSEQDLEQACDILESTVHDREHEEWKIRIWAMRTEPTSEVRRRKPSDKGHLRPASEAPEQEPDVAVDDFIVEDDSYEDAREIQPNDGDEHETDQEHDMQDSSPASPEAELPKEFTQDQPIPSIEVDTEMGEATEVPEAFEHNDDDARHLSIGSEPPGLPNTGVRDQDLVTPKNSKFAPNIEPGSDDLPSPSLFRPSSSKSKKKSGQTLSFADKHEVIFIASSPVIKTEKKPVQFTNNPDNDTIEDILNWDYADLEEQEDRKRLMLAMAFKISDNQRSALFNFFTGNMTTCLSHVRHAISCINDGREDFSEFEELPKEDYRKGKGPERDMDKVNENLPLAMQSAARLYKCWLHLDHSLYSKDVSGLSSSALGWGFEDDEQAFDDDLRHWHAITKTAIAKAVKFVNSKERDLIVIESDDDEDVTGVEPVSHTKQRKFKIQKDQGAAQKRAKAAERQALYESQNQNSQSASFMAGEDGDGVVALYAPDDVDSSKHVYLNQDIARRLKPHQIEGVKFMWREITATDDEDDKGQGCLLAHTMGLGKTAQSLALLTAIAETVRSDEKRDSLPADLKRARKKFRALILCPPSLLQNWKQEIQMWCPKGLFKVYSLDVGGTTLRLDEIRTWRKTGGIMLCGYNMFARLIDGKVGKAQAAYTEAEMKLIDESLLQKPHMVIADEVHQIKAETAHMSQAARKIKTHRRVGLTGSPMSNNTSEIFALINWVAPGFLGSASEFKQYYQEPIEAGSYIDSNAYERRRSLKKLEALKTIISPKLNRADITVLKGSLKSKVEFVLTIPLTEPQKLGYRRYVEEILGSKGNEEGSTITQVKLFGWLSILQLLCNHPSVFRNKLLEDKPARAKAKKVSLTSADDQIPGSTAPSSTAATIPASTARLSPSGDDDAPAFADLDITQFDINKAMVERLIEAVPDNAAIELSYKTLLVRKIINLSVAAGDKVLIFSQSIPSLNFLDSMLSDMRIRFARIQGDFAQDKRQRALKQMQDGLVDVMLISTRAGGLGLNIQQANRVIIFDFAFNPTWEEQAIGRTYRLGQTKPVFVYRFVAGGTFETSMYNKQLFKTGLASRVVDKKNPVRNANKKAADWLYYPQEVAQEEIGVEAGKDQHVMDKIIASHSSGEDSFIRNIKTMETLMEESKDEALTHEEMMEVQNEVMAAKTRKKGAGYESRTVLSLPTGSQTRPLGAGAVPVPVNFADAQQVQLERQRLQQELPQSPPPGSAQGDSSKGPARIIGRY